MDVRFDMSSFMGHVKDAEGYSSVPYRDTVGVLTIGYGRNLEKGLSREESEFLLSNDIADAVEDVSKYHWFSELDPVRQMVVTDMMFNLGADKFAKFKNMRSALSRHDYNLAAHEMKDSKWYDQVGRRSKKLCEAMITGIWQ